MIVQFFPILPFLSTMVFLSVVPAPMPMGTLPAASNAVLCSSFS